MKSWYGKVVREIKTKDGETVIIRYPTWEDRGQFYRLERETMIKEGSKGKTTRSSAHKVFMKNLLRTAEGKGVFLLADYKGEIIGDAIAWTWQNTCDHIAGAGVGVRKQYWNNGIGTQLMETIFEEVRRRVKGIKGIALESDESNKAANHIYEKLGFKIYGTLKGGTQNRKTKQLEASLKWIKNV